MFIYSKWPNNICTKRQGEQASRLPGLYANRYKMYIWQKPRRASKASHHQHRSMYVYLKVSCALRGLTLRRLLRSTRCGKLEPHNALLYGSYRIYNYRHLGFHFHLFILTKYLHNHTDPQFTYVHTYTQEGTFPPKCNETARQSNEKREKVKHHAQYIHSLYTIHNISFNRVRRALHDCFRQPNKQQPHTHTTPAIYLFSWHLTNIFCVHVLAIFKMAAAVRDSNNFDLHTHTRIYYDRSICMLFSTPKHVGKNWKTNKLRSICLRSTKGDSKKLMGKIFQHFWIY